MTLMENSSSFEIAIYRFRLLTWSKGLLKARNVGYGSWLMKERKIQAQKVFEGFKDLGSTSTIHQLSFSLSLWRKWHITLLIPKIRILLT
jgi:hypothetical protein